MNDRYRHPTTSRRHWAGKEARRRKTALPSLLRLSQQRLLQDPESGSSLVYALVIALVVIATGAALASRTLFSTFGASFNQDTRRASEAAEVGIQRTISELNREGNRGLLAVSPGSSKSSKAVFVSSQHPGQEATLVTCQRVIQTIAHLANVAAGYASLTSPNEGKGIAVRASAS